MILPRRAPKTNTQLLNYLLAKSSTDSYFAKAKQADNDFNSGYTIIPSHGSVYTLSARNIAAVPQSVTLMGSSAFSNTNGGEGTPPGGNTYPDKKFSINKCSQLASKISDFDRVYTIVAQNTNPFNVDVTFLGAYQFLSVGAALPFPAGVIVTIPESSYNELQFETIHRPFILGAMSVQSDVPAQLQQIPRFIHRSTNGVICSTPFHQFSYLSAFQFQGNLIEIYPICITVTGETQLATTLLPLSTTTITLFVTDRMDKARKLFGLPEMEYNYDVEPLFVNKLEVSVPPNLIG